MKPIEWLNWDVARQVGLFHRDWKPFSSGTAILNLPEIRWTDVIEPGNYTPTLVMKGQQRSGDALRIQYPFQLATFPITNAQFLAFIESTEHHYKMLPNTYRELGDPVVGIYHTDVVAFYCWLDHICRETGLLDAGWMIDLATQHEWIIGIDQLESQLEKRIRYGVGRPFLERCWQLYPKEFFRRVSYPSSRRSVLVDNHVTCAYIKGQVVVHWMPLLSLTEETSFRVVCRQI
jgi:hypothetical protein